MAVVVSSLNGSVRYGRKQQEDKDRLDEIFRTVDRLRWDADNCARLRKEVIPDAPASCLCVIHEDHKKASIISPSGWIEYRFDQTAHTLSRTVPDPSGQRGEPQILLDGVTDFFVAYFPESPSILYRIELKNKSQVRGYLMIR